MSDLFRKFADRMSHAAGTPWAFLLAFAAVAIWASTGPMFGYSDTWQLIINTSTTITTFLMVFLIQNTQNRDSRLVTLKLDELLRAVRGARTEMVNLDHMSTLNWRMCSSSSSTFRANSPNSSMTIWSMFSTS